MSFYKEVPGRKTTLESTLKFDIVPTAGGTNPVTSDGVKTAIDGAVGDAAENLQEQIDDIAERAGSGYTPKGEATVATLNGLSGQENGWLYTLTDAGTLTDGTLAVVAGDTVAWDATNGVWYKAMDYAPAQYGTNEVHNIPTSITAFRTGDVIPVDGPSGTAKMSKDDLLRETAENAVNSGVAADADDVKKNLSVAHSGSATINDFSCSLEVGTEYIFKVLADTEVSGTNAALLFMYKDGTNATIKNFGSVSFGSPLYAKGTPTKEINAVRLYTNVTGSFNFILSLAKSDSTFADTCEMEQTIEKHSDEIDEVLIHGSTSYRCYLNKSINNFKISMPNNNTYKIEAYTDESIAFTTCNLLLIYTDGTYEQIATYSNGNLKNGISLEATPSKDVSYLRVYVEGASSDYGKYFYITKSSPYQKDAIGNFSENTYTISVPVYQKQLDVVKNFNKGDHLDINCSFTGSLSFISVYIFRSDNTYEIVGDLVKDGVAKTISYNVTESFVKIRFFAQNTAKNTTSSSSVDLVVSSGLCQKIQETKIIAEQSAMFNVNSVLILGDSYSAEKKWTKAFERIVNVNEIVNLAVSGATLKDGSNDRATYPYDSRPTASASTNVNKNTIASQIEKLKRLMAGVDLDVGETQIFSGHKPNVIIIEASTNDVEDTDTQVNAYVSQIVDFVDNVYMKNLEAGGAVSLGSLCDIVDIENVDRTSFIGAVRYIYEQLNYIFENVPIFFVTSAGGLSYMNGSHAWVTNRLWYVKREQLMKACAMLGMPVVDWGGRARMSYVDNIVSGSGTSLDPYIIQNAGKYTRDGLHPKSAEEGGNRLAIEMASQLYPYSKICDFGSVLT